MLKNILVLVLLILILLSLLTIEIRESAGDKDHPEEIGV